MLLFTAQLRCCCFTKTKGHSTSRQCAVDAYLPAPHA
jgi:hypothetical protein